MDAITFNKKFRYALSRAGLERDLLLDELQKEIGVELEREDSFKRESLETSEENENGHVTKIRAVYFQQ